MSRRVDGPRFDARPESIGRDADASPAQPIERRRLNGINRRKAKGANSTSGAEGLETEAFNGPSAGTGGKSLDEILAEFVMPEIPEPAILRRSVPILHHFITEIVPDLEGGEPLRALARTLMEDEIERHRELLGRLQGGTGI
ncbi:MULTISPECIES: hypothetical protein [Phyllobacteriaceae]|uniref:Uncharacterized protein n=1 Tax=Mesorhizobium hungaricum TaxID=1566387 RepID=A0A1C2E0W5_9HYPH|nr:MULTISPECIES: hypothetical protein [Mesorhizobium]MDQ0331340.1 hypothetical protein [Mesorhizobium sp. YL-MeA3-2017]OCX20652.1 hypothetical protein QV13_08185 [Mesorhizobium hungaricum]